MGDPLPVGLVGVLVGDGFALEELTVEPAMNSGVSILNVGVR